MTLRASSASALVIGNELLSGKVEEQNLFALSQLLRQLGIRFVRAVLVPDEVPVIRREVEELSRTTDVVFTSGGVGPTHDDVTIEAVAQAFGVDTVIDPLLEGLLRRNYGEPLSAAHLRMAQIPRGAKLVSASDAHWPATLMQNVFVLPGVPEIFRMKLESVRTHLTGLEPYVSRAAFLNLEEVDLKAALDAVVARHPGVEIGSYPKWRDPSYRTKVTFDARDGAAVASALDDFVDQFPGNAVIRVE
jgi:molybdenum cofactor synthesis domain-containing protein